MALPSHVKYVVIGAGIHGLSSAWHLAQTLRRQGRGGGRDVLVIDKTAIGAGASGIACGVIRNNYFQPAMRRLMAHSVSVWEQDPKGFSYHPVGYMQISPEAMHADVATIAQQQKEIGYPSVFIEGEKDAMTYMKGIFEDWQAKGVTSVLHEKKGGYANNLASLYGLAGKAEAEDVRILTGVAVTGFEKDGSGAVTRVVTDRGTIECDMVIVGAGPWVRQIWAMLELPSEITIKGRDGTMHNAPMWTFWSLQEGTLGVDPSLQRTNDGKMAPVIHVDTDAPLYSDVDGSLITDQMWGLYYKPDFNFGGIQGGAMPLKVKAEPDQVKIDPYGPKSPDFVVGDDFAHMWCSALAFCQKRFEGKMPAYKKEPSGGIGSFTADSFPVFDRFCENVYVIADSNHGYKMIGVGKLVAEDICGNPSDILEPFRFSRFAQGKLHPTSNSPFPWS
ncbi:NAD(P)/FAD-dependent oxidoreductase [Rhodoligotrophos defluvii]|uniref:NAD(P)/FAD-dependent oxidoreductase n=1 Tax=Rhodoligotrophos defluvii TaxID=2561934 RepID=UPI0010C9C0FC|nr:FAD-binding oxidoreductase [Rhodoligotrophos defluvii]